MKRIATPTYTAFKKHSRMQPALSKPRLALASAPTWTHTLMLTGELSHRTAHALEAEIERLCEEGVTGITLDLRELIYIDWPGVAVIVFRAGLCKKRGYEFALIPGSASIHRAFEQAGVADLLPFQDVPGPTAEIQHRSPRRAPQINARDQRTSRSRRRIAKDPATSQ